MATDNEMVEFIWENYGPVLGNQIELLFEGTLIPEVDQSMFADFMRRSITREMAEHGTT